MRSRQAPFLGAGRSPACSALCILALHSSDPCCSWSRHVSLESARLRQKQGESGEQPASACRARLSSRPLSSRQVKRDPQTSVSCPLLARACGADKRARHESRTRRNGERSAACSPFSRRGLAAVPLAAAQQSQPQETRTAAEGAAMKVVTFHTHKTQERPRPVVPLPSGRVFLCLRPAPSPARLYPCPQESKQNSRCFTGRAS